MTTIEDALSDPRLRGSYREPRSPVEVNREGHYFHMQAARQDDWLRQLFARADKMKAEQEAKLEKDLEVWRKTGKMPGSRVARKKP